MTVTRNNLNSRRRDGSVANRMDCAGEGGGRTMCDAHGDHGSPQPAGAPEYDAHRLLVRESTRSGVAGRLMHKRCKPFLPLRNAGASSFGRALNLLPDDGAVRN
ncbi:hypothetical protein JZU57_01820 [bacterium]|nr:hypothetical protein [bacterium]